ncbi:MAG: DUF6580 family putative transport protein [Saprospiraceae bacterium]
MNYRLALILVGLAALTRVLPHPDNFTAFGAMGLFAGAYLRPVWLRFAAPFIALFLSDLYINNVVYAQYYDHFVWIGSLWTYGAFALVTVFGRLFLSGRVSALRVPVAAALGAFLFFAISNFGVWFGSGMYPHTGAGLAACYAAGLPFLDNTIMSDLAYSAALFGVYEWALRVRGAKQTA